MPKLHIRPEHEFIDLDFAIAGLNDFFSSNTSRTIRFFSSGEATQAFDRMREIHRQARSMAGKDLRTELQTNGFFGGEVADWIEEKVDILWISCDGPPAVQNSQRPALGNLPSSEMVNANIQRYARRPGMQFGVRATLTELDFDKQIELIEYFHQLGVRYVCAAPTYHSTVNPEVTTPPLLEFARHFEFAFQRAQELGMFYQTHLIVNFDEKVESYCRACTPCPHLTTDGYVTCCDWASFGPQYLPGPLQQCVYGYFDKARKRILYDEQRIAAIRRRNVAHLQHGYCKGCKALVHCAGGCIGKMIVETDDMYEATPAWCQAVRYLFDKLPVDKGLFPCHHS